MRRKITKLKHTAAYRRFYAEYSQDDVDDFETCYYCGCRGGCDCDQSHQARLEHHADAFNDTMSLLHSRFPDLARVGNEHPLRHIERVRRNIVNPLPEADVDQVPF